MVRLDRASVPVPKVFSSAALIAESTRATEFYLKNRKKRSQARFSWDRTIQLIRMDASEALLTISHGKCCYCETIIDNPASKPDLEHFRPKSGALGLDGKYDPDHYWWLATEWANCLPACTKCNVSKGKRFPVKKRRAHPGMTGSQLLAEEPLLLNPCEDNPEEHLFFSENGTVSSSTERGQITIEVLALNREALVASRKEHLAKVLEVVGLTASRPDGLARIQHLLSPDAPFRAATKQVIERNLDSLGVSRRQLSKSGLNAAKKNELQHAEHAFETRQRIKEKHSVEDDAKQAREAYFSGVRRIERVQIENFKGVRCFEMTLPGSSPGREGWMMFVGENATGKSSILQAIALTLLGQEGVKKLGLDARRFVTNGEKTGFVRVHLTNVRQPIELLLDSQSREFLVDPPSEMVLLLGYGATRLLPRVARRNAPVERYVRVKNLFNPYARLQNSEKWLVDKTKMSDSRFDQIAWTLKELLMLSPEDTIVRQKGRVRVEMGGHSATLSQLSDGYQSVVALATDIMMGLSSKWTSMDVAEGVVLIDEIETHLHPVWKLEIVSRLRAVFPKLQFLCTTHDPLCLRGLQPGEVNVLRKENDQIEQTIVTESIDHLRADQLLTSPLFGLLSTRSPEFQGHTERYTTLLAKKNRTAEEEAELAGLRARLSTEIQSGETPGERFIEQAVRESVRRLTSDAPAAVKISESMAPNAQEEIRKRLEQLLN